MVAILRRSRLLALALVLVAPGVAGTWVQWLHPCPIEGFSSRGHHHEAGSTRAPGKTCHCIGSCHSVAPPALTGTPTLIVKLAEPVRTTISPGASQPVSTASHLLPPATAPPRS
jgi:hypothetical protein